jgi:hypothetical protein
MAEARLRQLFPFSTSGISTIKRERRGGGVGGSMEIRHRELDLPGFRIYQALRTEIRRIASRTNPRMGVHEPRSVAISNIEMRESDYEVIRTAKINSQSSKIARTFAPDQL